MPGTQWLEEKGNEEGVVSLESGLRHKVSLGKAWAKFVEHKSARAVQGHLTPVNVESSSMP